MCGLAVISQALLFTWFKLCVCLSLQNQKMKGKKKRKECKKQAKQQKAKETVKQNSKHRCV